MRKYHTLLERDNVDAPWRIEFGDYDRGVVRDELIDQADGGIIKRANLKIITTGDQQADIEAAVAKLNAQED